MDREKNYQELKKFLKHIDKFGAKAEGGEYEITISLGGEKVNVDFNLENQDALTRFIKQAVKTSELYFPEFKRLAKGGKITFKQLFK